MLRTVGLGLGVLFGLAALWTFAGASGWLGTDEAAGTVHDAPRPNALVSTRAAKQADSAHRLGANDSKQILFGDFHVHTTFSFDAFLMNMPMAGGPGTHPPADACDFARFCSALDFWSINDHAENLTQDLWRKTIDSVRECNAVAGNPADPDLVTYLGWEWSHIGTTPEDHYGHKNVVFRGLDADEIPARPISSQAIGNDELPISLAMRAALATFGGERGRSFSRLIRNVTNAGDCPTGLPVRELPLDCIESATTPEALFAKLDDWGHDSIVIPHGTAWGLYTPAGSDWRKQLPGHDPARQTLVEIYSGHGNSEQLPDWRPVEVAADGSLACPEPSDGYLPSCWHAGTLVESRCKAIGESDAECAQRASDARANYVAAHQAGWKTLPGHETSAWLDAGQAPDMFQPAFNYRPLGSAQYMLAVRDFSDPANPKGFDFGFIGSSDNHTARPGTGFKEFARGEMTEGRGRQGEASGDRVGLFGSSNAADAPAAESVPWTGDASNPLGLFEAERGAAYFVTGGLVAAHSTGRDRDSIWEALDRKEVYATSGRRTLLWFDLVDDGLTLPMGSTTERKDAPSFRVRATGSFEQQPGCPDHVTAALGRDRVEHICKGECYFPSEVRRPITRIEIVRVRPQKTADEPLDGLVEDPWRTFSCPADGAGCVAEFRDDEFAEARRDVVYYARAIEAPDALIHGDNGLGCRYDEAGNCVELSMCGGGAPYEDDCLAEAEPRAWSSPIFVNYAGS